MRTPPQPYKIYAKFLLTTFNINVGADRRADAIPFTSFTSYRSFLYIVKVQAESQKQETVSRLKLLGNKNTATTKVMT